MRIHHLLELALNMGNPIIEDNKATFVWQGPIAPLVMDDLHNWEDSPQRMKRVGKELWSLSLALPKDAYLEYAFFDVKTRERLADPLNPNCVDNGINNYNHFFYMPKARPTSLVRPKKGNPHGTVTPYEMPTRDLAVGSKRAVYLYEPPIEGRVPLVVVYDGADYLRLGKLNVIVDNLINRGRIRPFAMALVENGGQARVLEYSCAEATLGLIKECVIPLAREHLDLVRPSEEPYGIIGASMGGLMALYTGIRLPRTFGKVLSQSGAFGIPEYRYAIRDLIRYAPRPGIRIWMDAGCFEWLLEPNRKMYSMLKQKEYQVDYREYSGGHNYTAWRNDIANGLKKLFGK